MAKANRKARAKKTWRMFGVKLHPSSSQVTKANKAKKARLRSERQKINQAKFGVN